MNQKAASIVIKWVNILKIQSVRPTIRHGNLLKSLSKHRSVLSNVVDTEDQK